MSAGGQPAEPCPRGGPCSAGSSPVPSPASPAPEEVSGAAGSGWWWGPAASWASGVRGALRSGGSPVSDDDAWDLITCFCMKPFAGRPMIECNECATWIHLSCAKIRKSNVPDIFICQRCRDAKQEIRRSNRARTVPRKRLVD
uniref:PHD finger protein 13 n=1 Tax=Junco hyemalis TaxID=40217 RepID=A0A8C5J5J4_JUNHY